MKIQEVCNYMEAWAPLEWQESYDNAGLIIGDPHQLVKGILVSFDCTEEIVDEAIEKNCNLIIAHHPILFKSLKKINGKNYVEKTIIKALKHDIALYASHTNLDHAPKGVSYILAEKLKLNQIKVLDPFKESLKSLVFFVDENHEEQVSKALFKAGAGNIGNYTDCKFVGKGWGHFTPNDAANPTIGEKNIPEKVKEKRVELIFPKHLETSIIQALKVNHPYEEVAYYIQTLDNIWQDVGAGAIGELPKEMEPEEFFSYVKKTLGLKMIRLTKNKKEKIKKVAVCGGAGSFLIEKAKKAGADVFLTGDLKYHEFFDGENQLILGDIGHFESEIFIKDAIHLYLSKKFSNFAVLNSERNTNPVHYF